MAKIMTLQQFEAAIGEKLTFFKGKKRPFAPSPLGNVFVAVSYDPKKPGFVTEAGKDLVTKTGESLEGSLWLCNTSLKVYDLSSHKPKGKKDEEGE